MKSFFVIIFFVTVISAQDAQDAIDKLSPCGLNGFRCLDAKRAQICDEKYENAESFTTLRPRIFECADGLVCDEEKIEYCAPSEKPANASTTEKSFFKRNAMQFHLSKRFDFDDDDDFSTTEATRTTFDDDDDDDEPHGPTEEPENDPWNGNPPITCTSHGFHPGL